MAKHDSHAAGNRLLGVICMFYLSAFLLLALKSMRLDGFILALAVPALIMIGTRLIGRLFPADRLLLALTNFLCALGVLVLYSTDPALAQRQAVSYGVGILCMIICIFLVRLIRHWQIPVLLMMPVSIVLLLMPILSGQTTNGAANWFYVAGLSIQPSEIVKLSLVVCVSWWMSRRRVLPWLLFTVACLLLLMKQADLGTALMYYLTVLMLLFASTGNLLYTAIGIGGAGGAAVLGYNLFAHVRKRVAVWRNPWSDYNSGYQIVQGLLAIASGGWFGVGLGLGSPESIPYYYNDYIFAVICEQFGLIFGVCVLAMYVALLWRGATIAMGARRSFHGLLAMGCTAMVGLQTFTIIGGVLKLIPLTGVTLPFVSYGGTSLVSSMCLIGLLQGVESLNEDDLQEDTHMAMLGSEVKR